MNSAKGRVYFIGAGPGDPELITLKGRRLIGAADLVLFADSLCDAALAAWAKPGARVQGSGSLTHEEIVGLMVPVAESGGTVARVHSGDPSLYGAVYEQAWELDRRGIPYEVVPGVSAAFAASAALGVALTVPGVAQSVILTRVEGRTPMPAGERLRDLARHGTTVCLYLSAALIETAVVELLAGGYPPSTPAVVVQRASWPDQRLVRGTLTEIAERTRAAGIKAQAIIIVGKVLDPDLHARTAGMSRLYAADFSHGFRRAQAPERIRHEGEQQEASER